MLQLPREVDDSSCARIKDENGHMNIRHYSTWPRARRRIFSRVGITDDYRRITPSASSPPSTTCATSPRSTSATVCPAMCASSRSKVVHAMAFLVNDTARQLAYTLEVIALHVDLSARRTAPYADDIARAWDNEIKATADVAWEAPVCGAMGIRR